MMQLGDDLHRQPPSWMLVGMGIGYGVLISLCVALYALMLSIGG